MRLFFLIRSLEHGGAERQLIELVKTLDRSRFEITVATFYDGGALRPLLERVPGVHVVSLRKRSRWDVLGFLGRLRREVRRARPDVIHGYLNVANELGLAVGRLSGAKVVWGLRMSEMDWSKHERIAATSERIGAWLSPLADLHIANSEAGQRAYVAAGYPADRVVVVSNGIDIDVFKPEAESRQRLRAEWGIAETDHVIGTVGRIDPQKDHPTFLRAAAVLSRARPGVRFVIVGDGPARYRQSAEALARELGIAERVRWVKGSNEMSALYNALDVLTLCSAYGEGFPNVVGEAMACGTPVFATDVGDASVIIDDPRRIVPPGDPSALAAAWECLLASEASERAAIGARARERIVSRYSVRVLATKTAALLEALV